MLKDNDMYKKQSYIFDEWRVYRLVFYLWYGLNHDQLQKVNVTADAICSKFNDGTLKSNIHHSYQVQIVTIYIFMVQLNVACVKIKSKFRQCMHVHVFDFTWKRVEQVEKIRK